MSTNTKTLQDANASVNETGSVLLVAQYGVVLVALHIIVLLLFVPFEGARFYYTFLTLVPTAVLAPYTIFFGTRSETLAILLFAGALLLLFLAVVELALRTLLFGADRLVSLTAVLDVVLWIITLLYTVLAVFWVLSAYRLRSVFAARAGVNSDEQPQQQSGARVEYGMTTRASAARRRTATTGVDMTDNV